MKGEIFILIFLICTNFLAAKAFSYEKSVVQVTVFKQAPNYEAPWLKKPVARVNHLGTLIKKNSVLISASAVIHSALIEVNRVGLTNRIPMQVTSIDYNSNLALISPVNLGALNKLKPLKIGADLPLDTQVNLISGRVNQRLVMIPLRMREVDIQRVISSPYSIAHYRFDVSQSSGLGWSEPIIHNDKLVGMSVGQDSDFVYGIPSKLINDFLIRSQQQPYVGFTSIGIGISKMLSPYLRSYYKVPENIKGGVLVTDIFESSPFFGILQTGDLLLKVENVPISNSGYYKHKLWQRIHFIDLVTDYRAGDTIDLKVFRNGKQLSLSAKGKPFDSQARLIPSQSFSDSIPHLIFGGLIFQNLDLGYLQSWGGNWLKDAPDEMVFLWKYKNPVSDDGRRVIVLNRILPHIFNKGYEWMSHMTLKKINGSPVDSLEQLKSIINKADSLGEELIKLEFGDGGGEIAISLKGLGKVHQDLAKQYNIPTTSFWSTKNINL